MRFVDLNSIVIDDSFLEDKPVYEDATIASAKFDDGTPLSDAELIMFHAKNSGLVFELAIEQFGTLESYP